VHLNELHSSAHTERASIRRTSVDPTKARNSGRHRGITGTNPNTTPITSWSKSSTSVRRAAKARGESSARSRATWEAGRRVRSPATGSQRTRGRSSRPSANPSWLTNEQPERPAGGTLAAAVAGPGVCDDARSGRLAGSSRSGPVGGWSWGPMRRWRTSSADRRADGRSTRRSWSGDVPPFRVDPASERSSRSSCRAWLPNGGALGDLAVCL
jgi:hypothetical protein